MNYKYYIVYKPYQVLSQFTSTEGKLCLKDFFEVEKDVYPVGRLDFDSEGLLILTNDTSLNHRLLHPKFIHKRSYLVQADGAIDEDALNWLSTGVMIHLNGNAYRTLPCRASIFSEPPVVPERNPPVRFRKYIPTSWIRLILTEGKNRQVRRMMAAVGFPTLRLIRDSIENITLDDLQPGEMKTLSHEAITHKLFGK